MLAAVMFQVPSTWVAGPGTGPAVNSAAAGRRGCRYRERARRRRPGVPRAIQLARPGTGFDFTIRLCAGRRAAFAPRITGRFPLAQVSQALTASERPEHLKIVLDAARR